MEIPKHWERVSLRELVSTRKGKKPLKLSKDEFFESVPYLDIQAIENGVITQYADASSSVLGEETDIFIVWDGSRSGLVAKGMRGAVGSTIMCITPFVINQKYLLYFLQSNYEYLNQNTTGASIPHLNSQLFFDLEVPLPPLEEQETIVEDLEKKIHQLESQFKNNEKELRNILEYKRSILTEAMTGQLTENWRMQQPLPPNKLKVDLLDISLPPYWKSIKGQDIFDLVTSGSRSWSKYYSESGAMFIRVGNLTRNSLELNLAPEKVIYVKLSDKTEGVRTKLQKGDILISITADIGLIGFVNSSMPESYVNQHIALARPNIKFDSKFLAYFLLSDLGQQQLRSKISGSTKSGLNLGDINSVAFIIPPIDEQIEIVRQLDLLLAASEFTEQKYFESLEQIKILNKAVLLTAFTGELSNQFSNDKQWYSHFKIALSQKKKVFEEKVNLSSVKNAFELKKIKLGMLKKKTLIEILNNSPNRELLVEELWQQSTYFDKGRIEEFYEELEKYMKENAETEDIIVSEFKDLEKTKVIIKLHRNANPAS